MVNFQSTILGLASAATATALARDPPVGTWQAPGPGDYRAPCPVMNTLANHGFLPRDGKGITVPRVASAINSAFNMGPEIALLITAPAIINCAKSPLSLQFDLIDLNKHNAVEHDVSYTRDDYFNYGDDHSFNATIWKTVVDVISRSPKTSVRSMTDARNMRAEACAAADPQMVWNTQTKMTAFAETAAVLCALGDCVNGEVPVDYLRYLVENERLPYDLGFTRSAKKINALNILQLQGKFITADGTIFPPGSIISQAMNVLASLGQNPVSGTIGILGQKVLGLIGLASDDSMTVTV